MLLWGYVRSERWFLLSQTATLTPLSGKATFQMARPRIDDALRRSEQLGIRLTVAEKTAVRWAANRAGRSPVEWVREVALAAADAPSPAPTADERERRKRWLYMWRQLVRVGVNLNQFAVRLNAFDDTVTGDEVRKALDAVREVVDKELSRWSPGQ